MIIVAALLSVGSTAATMGQEPKEGGRQQRKKADQRLNTRYVT
ncbi:MAG: hypothetical protein ACREUE_16855 [Panacagrimonas sp.]